ncbi:hypothetical protein JAAARDRAFT_48047 [Jaapia argillacea MUCL 33604]|uniref:Uncharacterized protein n=1 Tax=Jaapia argillacea MUCL 33604 TaxID=933084 RepID=A0A067Q2C1_9AGAM|nr:hypothetical protein JAAARDRAFT_48047 [Jaapia argillacea MUCL 33604]
MTAISSLANLTSLINQDDDSLLASFINRQIYVSSALKQCSILLAYLVNLILVYFIYNKHSFWYSGKKFIDKFSKAVKKYNSSGHVTHVRQLVEASYAADGVSHMSWEAEEEWLYQIIINNLMPH